MKMRLIVGAQSLDVTLDDSPAARSLVAQLPLQLAAHDFDSTEKIATPPAPLDTTDASAGYDPDPGDLAYYAPWGNLAIFYRDAPYAAGLVKLGRVSGISVLAAQTGAFTLRLERS